MTFNSTNLYLCANTHAREGGRGAGEHSALYTSTLVHLKPAALRQLQQLDSAYSHVEQCLKYMPHKYCLIIHRRIIT